MNTENYDKVKITDFRRAKAYNNTHLCKDIAKLSEDTALVALENENFKCDIYIDEAFFNLDNAKYWYLVFIYDFMDKCLDMNKIHFIEADTDFAYWAGVGNPVDDNTHGFKHVILDHKFYNANIFKFRRVIPSTTHYR